MLVLTPEQLAGRVPAAFFDRYRDIFNIAGTMQLCIYNAYRHNAGDGDWQTEESKRWTDKLAEMHAEACALLEASEQREG